MRAPRACSSHIAARFAVLVGLPLGMAEDALDPYEERLAEFRAERRPREPTAQLIQTDLATMSFNCSRNALRPWLLVDRQADSASSTNAASAAEGSVCLRASSSQPAR